MSIIDMTNRETDMKEAEWALPDHFFEENPLDEMTVGHLSFFKMQVFGSDLNEMIADSVIPYIDKEREAIIQIEKEAIDSLSAPEELVNFMRKRIDTLSREYLCQKAVSIGGDIQGLLIDKLGRNGMDAFIESAMLVLSRANETYIDRMVKEFRQFRNGYARAQATILLAYRKREDALKSMYEEYVDFSRNQNDDNSQTVLYSIYALTGNVDVEMNKQMAEI